MKLSIRNLCVFAVLSFAASLFAQVPHLQPFSADMTVTSARGGAQRDMTGRMYVGHGAMRWDMQADAGHQMIMINNFATKTTDMLMPQQHMYMEFKAGENSMHRGPDTSNMHPYDPANPCASDPDLTCKNLGTETVNGRTTDHWQITHKKDGSTGEVWIDKTLHFPIRAKSDDSMWNLTNIKEGEPEASLFEIPSGYQKMDMSGMMGGGRPPQH